MALNLTGPALAVLAGFILDQIFGDPDTPLHPIRMIGKLIEKLEHLIRRAFPKTEAGERAGGMVLAILVILISSGIPAWILILLYHLRFWIGVAAESLMCYSLLAVRSLKKESGNVAAALDEGGLEEGRRAVARIVGRDTGSLSEAGITRAAVESVAENFSDGVIAPMLAMMLGGAVLGFVYKSINTMDSMIGYKNDRYLYFGWFAAKLDDVVNFIPSRLSALLLIVTAPLAGLDGRNAFRIWRRDRRNHASPNSAQTEAAAAGALHIQLGGNAFYFGKLYKKPYIGDNDRRIEPEDIARMNTLMVSASVLALLLFEAVRAGILLLI